MESPQDINLTISDKEIKPHFTSESSSRAEDTLAAILSEISQTKPEVQPFSIDRDTVIAKVQRFHPERYNLVLSKLQSENLTLSDLDDKTLLDRLLGIDGVVRYKDKTIAFDVTSGKGTLLHNKSQKQEGFADVYQEIGIDYSFVVKIRQEPDDNSATKLLLDIDQSLGNNNPHYGQVLKIS